MGIRKFNPSALIALSLSVLTSACLSADLVKVGAGSSANSAAISIATSASPSPTPSFSVTSVSPVEGPASGGTALSITGVGFQNGATIMVGGVSCASVTVVSSTQITCTTGVNVADAVVDIVVTNPGLTTATLSASYAYEQVPATFLYSPSSLTATIGVSVANQIPTVSAVHGLSYSVAPPLPSGLLLDTLTGIISGTPSVLAAPSGYTITAANTAGSATFSFGIAVNDVIPSISYLPQQYIFPLGLSVAGMVNLTNFGGAITSCSSTPPLPSGISLSSTCNLSGSPLPVTSASPYTISATNSGGTANAGVTFETRNLKFTWVAGPNTMNQAGAFGTQGIASGGTPAARSNASMAIDSSNSLWVFGGIKDASNNLFNDFWRFTGTSWIWIKPTTPTPNAAGVYGTIGNASPSNSPGARSDSVSWADGTGNVYLFGGMGYPTSGGPVLMNDLWSFSTGTNNWTWKKGSNNTSATATYGAVQVASGTNVPGGRMDAAVWYDGTNAWVFGGIGIDGSFVQGALSDIWKWDGANWTWMSGPSVAGSPPTFGTQGVANAANTPGGRSGMAYWKDPSGKFWIFGGTDGSGGLHNDLWKYDPAANTWTWVSGANTQNALANYGGQRAPQLGNVPGSRTGASGWTDSSGNTFIFGGFGFDLVNSTGQLNDLWRMDTSNKWVWLNGAAFKNVMGNYGSLSIGSAMNFPGGHVGMSVAVDVSGNAYLFGGFGQDSVVSTPGYLSDLWKYQF